MFCSKFQAKIRGLLRRFNVYINNNIDLALEVTSNIKSFLDSPVADVLTAIIPGHLDDLIKDRLSIALREVIPLLQITAACNDCKTVEETLQCWAVNLKKVEGPIADALLHKLAALLAAKLDDHRLPQNLYDLYTQGKYSALKK